MPTMVQVDLDGVLGELLRHEQHFWYDSARAAGLGEGQDGTTPGSAAADRRGRVPAGGRQPGRRPGPCPGGCRGCPRR